MTQQTQSSPRSLSHLSRLAAAGVLLSGLVAAGALEAKAPPESFAELVDDLLPTVVNISTSQVPEGAEGPGQGQEEFEEFFKEFFERRGEQPRRRRQSSLGSGFIIDPSGYIVTNHHVIEGADEISVRLADETMLDATLVGSDEKTDLALLKVERDSPLPSADWGNSEETRIGDWVIAIGNPFGLGGTVTAGIVSARQRDINAGPYDDFIQTDAAINRGNSGGPMFNLDGDVIGINSAIFSPSGGSIGIGFAIPSSLARNIIEQLRDHGTVRRGWLGVRIQAVTEELAEGLRLDEPRGALVASVTKGGPAEGAGLKQGDVVLEFNGRPVRKYRNLSRMVAETPVGKDVDVVVWRKGEAVTLQVMLGELKDETLAALTTQKPETEPESVSGEVPELGIKLAEITPDLRQKFELAEGTDGVVILDVEAGGNADEKNLQPGDVIAEIDLEEVRSPADVADKVEKAKDEGHRVVTLLVFRHGKGDYEWIAVRLNDS
ncbi:MAG: DegQ family serine endoprotease [Pseudomonadota bacterium]